MKQIFKMTDQELIEMIDISRKPSMPVMLIGDVATGHEKQESANDFWKQLAKKYGFLWDSVEPAPDKGYNFFMAEPFTEPEPKPNMLDSISEALNIILANSFDVHIVEQKAKEALDIIKTAKQ